PATTAIEAACPSAELEDMPARQRSWQPGSPLHDLLSWVDQQPGQHSDQHHQAAEVEPSGPAEMGGDHWREHGRQHPSQVAAGVQDAARGANVLARYFDRYRPEGALRAGGESQ